MLGGNITEPGLVMKPRRLPSWQMAVPTNRQDPRCIEYPLPNERKYNPTANPQADRPNVVILHDSFMGALAGFLNEHFQRVCYDRRNDKQGDRFPAELIERERPTMVIDEMVQRRLQLAPLALPPAGERIASQPGPSVPLN